MRAAGSARESICERERKERNFKKDIVQLLERYLIVFVYCLFELLRVCTRKVVHGCLLLTVGAFNDC